MYNLQMIKVIWKTVKIVLLWMKWNKELNWFYREIGQPPPGPPHPTTIAFVSKSIRQARKLINTLTIPNLFGTSLKTHFLCGKTAWGQVAAYKLQNSKRPASCRLDSHIDSDLEDCKTQLCLHTQQPAKHFFFKMTSILAHAYTQAHLDVWSSTLYTVLPDRIFFLLCRPYRQWPSVPAQPTLNKSDSEIKGCKLNNFTALFSSAGRNKKML